MSKSEDTKNRRLKLGGLIAALFLASAVAGLVLWRTKDPEGLSIHTEKLISQILTICGTLLTTGLSAYSLRRKTVVESDDPRIPNKFTPAGRHYLIALVLSASLTILTSLWGNSVDAEIKAEAEKTGNDALREQLTIQNAKLVGALKPDLDQQKRQLENLNDLESKLTHTTSQIAQQASRELRNTKDDLATANIVLTDVEITLRTPGLHLIPPEGDVQEQLRQRIESVCPSGPGPYELKGECADAHAALDNWEGYFGLLHLLDPRGDLALHISIDFPNMTVFVTTTKCRVAPQGATYKCLRFSSMPLGERSLTLLNVQESLVGEGVRLIAPKENPIFTSPIYGRDTVTNHMYMEACAEDGGSLKAISLKSFPTIDRWEVTVTGLESPLRSSVRSYSFKVIRRYSGRPGCVSLFYDRD